MLSSSQTMLTRQAFVCECRASSRYGDPGIHQVGDPAVGLSLATMALAAKQQDMRLYSC
jgi:hypothetical protein